MTIAAQPLGAASSLLCPRAATYRLGVSSSLRRGGLFFRRAATHGQARPAPGGRDSAGGTYSETVAAEADLAPLDSYRGAGCRRDAPPSSLLALAGRVMSLPGAFLAAAE